MNTPNTRPNAEDYQQAMQSMDIPMDVSVEDLMTLAERAEQFARQRSMAGGTVASIMTQPVVTVAPHTSLKEAAHLLVSKRVSGLPVVDENKRLVGLITEADFLRILGVPSPLPSHSLWHTLENLFSHLTHPNRAEAPDEPIDGHMVRHVITANPADGIHKVLDLMKRHQVKRVVIVDDAQQVCGIVTRSNLVRLFFDSVLNPAKPPAS